MTVALSAKRPLPLALALAVLGSAALIVTEFFVSSGPLILVTYTLLVLGSLVAVRLAGFATFSERF